VTVIDRRPALLAPERFAAAVRRLHADAQDPALRAALHDRCHVVVMTHNYADDRQYLQALLPTAVPYIGLLGPRQRSARLLEHLGINRPADLQRIHAPVGLDLGGEGAEQVALSIVSEVLAVHAGRQARSLRERRHAIHARAV
jgi:xanthine/CO dehydrogenase XdhC/CoxF family maturation factor